MEENREKRRDALDTEHIVRTYFHLALPVVVGSIITIIYSLADTYFIAQTDNALLVAGVSVCAPLFTILMAFGNIFGQGGSSLISRLLGRKETETVGRISSFCFYIALLTGTVVGGGMLLFRDPLLGAQSPSALILEPQKIKSDTVSTVSPSISHEVIYNYNTYFKSEI